MTLTAAKLIAEAQEHRPRMRFFVQECATDRHTWPCLTRRLADALIAERAKFGAVLRLLPDPWDDQVRNAVEAASREPLPIVPIEPDVMEDER